MAAPAPAMILKHVLDNGAVVLIDEMRDVRSFTLGVFVPAGSAAEPAPRRGISHFLEHVLFKRTRRRTNVAIARAIDRLGGDVDAFTTKEYTGFYVHTLDMRFDGALDLMGDVVLSPAFTAADVRRAGVILEEIGEVTTIPRSRPRDVRASFGGATSRRPDSRHHTDGPLDGRRSLLFRSRTSQPHRRLAGTFPPWALGDPRLFRGRAASRGVGRGPPAHATSSSSRAAAQAGACVRRRAAAAAAGASRPACSTSCSAAWSSASSNR
jgi:hypothetical protein